MKLGRKPNQKILKLTIDARAALIAAKQAKTPALERVVRQAEAKRDAGLLVRAYGEEALAWQQVGAARGKAQHLLAELEMRKGDGSLDLPSVPALLVGIPCNLDLVAKDISWIAARTDIRERHLALFRHYGLNVEALAQ